MTQLEHEQSLNSELVRKCTKCFGTKKITDFYNKGDRLESCCKKCKSSSRKSSYVTKKSQDIFGTTKKLFEIYYDAELRSLDKISLRLEDLLKAKANQEVYGED